MRLYGWLVAGRGFDGSYPIVQRYVKRWRRGRRLPGDGYLELEWSPGVMRAGFRAGVGRGGGEPDGCALSGRLVPVSGSCVIPWPCPGRTRSACAVGLLGIFEHVGAVPPVLVLDNAPRRRP